MKQLLRLTLAATAGFSGAPDGWHKTMQAGVDAARRSGKPVLVVTAWTDEQ